MATSENVNQGGADAGDSGLDDNICESRGCVEQNGTVYAAVPSEVADELDLEHQDRVLWSGEEGDETVSMQSADTAVNSLNE